MNTTEQLKTYENRLAFIRMNDMTVYVTIKSARRRFGHIDFLVTPIQGGGEKWLEHHKVHLMDGGTAWAHETVLTPNA